MTTVVIGNSGSGNSNNEETTEEREVNNNNEETAEEHEVRVQREIEEANAIQDRRIKRKTEEEYARTYHPKTVRWFKKEYPDLVEDAKIKYDKLEWIQFKRFLGTRKVRKRKKYRKDNNNIYQLAGVSNVRTVPTVFG